MTPIFSILHPSARPQQWREIYEDWMLSAAHPETVEYVLCVDERWGFLELPGFQLNPPSVANGVSIPCDFPSYWAPGTKLDLGGNPAGKLVWNIGRRCYVDAVNTAARVSTGHILMVIADDQWPCERWDEKLLEAIDVSRWPYEVFQKWLPEVNASNEPYSAESKSRAQWVIEVSTGTPYEHHRGIMVMPILSRARYERLGYVFYPEYESVFADNDFYAHAQHDKCIIDARYLMFPHRHPLAEPGAWEKRADGKWTTRDKVYAAQNRPEAYRTGEEIFKRRAATGFSKTPVRSVEEAVQAINRSWKDSMESHPARPVKGGIALALPGESFSNVWVAKLLEIVTYLLREGWNFCTLLQHTSEPGITRATIIKSLAELKGQFDPEFILWMDDDQIVDPQQVRMLIEDAEQFQDVDLIAGWTWIASSGPHSNDPQVSCGRMDLAKGELSYAEHRSVQAANGVFEVSWTGFPVVLMRTRALEKTGKHPFAHMPCPESPWGECGEDISFCKRLTDAGGKIYVDSRIFVPHLKLKALGPVPASQQEVSLALTGRSGNDIAIPEAPAPPKDSGMGPSTSCIAFKVPGYEAESRKKEREDREKGWVPMVGDSMVKVNADAARFAAQVFEELP
jgi:hypothetical protein